MTCSVDSGFCLRIPSFLLVLLLVLLVLLTKINIDFFASVQLWFLTFFWVPKQPFLDFCSSSFSHKVQPVRHNPIPCHSLGMCWWQRLAVSQINLKCLKLTQNVSNQVEVKAWRTARKSVSEVREKTTTVLGHTNLVMLYRAAWKIKTIANRRLG